jgi:hypothetical protein
MRQIARSGDARETTFREKYFIEKSTRCKADNSGMDVSEEIHGHGAIRVPLIVERASRYTPSKRCF